MQDQPRLEPIANLVDFYARWPMLRRQMQKVASGAPLSSDDQQVLQWLIRIIDMVGPGDLGSAVPRPVKKPED